MLTYCGMVPPPVDTSDDPSVIEESCAGEWPHGVAEQSSAIIESCHTSIMSYGSTYRVHSVSRFQNDLVLVNHQDAPWPRIF